MANNTMKKVDALGFDRFQIASVRRDVQSNNQLYKRMDTLTERAKAIAEEYKALEQQAELREGPAKQISKEVLGIELNPRQILYFHENPEAFYQQYPELRPNQVEVPAEGASGEGELKEEVPTEETAEPAKPADEADPFN